MSVQLLLVHTCKEYCRLMHLETQFLDLFREEQSLINAFSFCKGGKPPIAIKGTILSVSLAVKKECFVLLHPLHRSLKIVFTMRVLGSYLVPQLQTII